MSAPREERGIGFRMIHEFNLALLAKQLWRLFQFLDSLVARVLQGKYYRLSLPFRIGTVDTPSYVWTSIIAARKLLLLDFISKVHSGYAINVWEDLWIPSTPARPARARAPAVNPKMIVSSLINPVTKGMGCSITRTICSSRRYSADSEFGHKPYPST